ncbi:hypothetical protein HZS_3171 [Henneguya salminicola]|nr:hypothetical protein HZS_3171 [Henneguya salminicola]
MFKSAHKSAQRWHKERSQLTGRNKYGPLEKHKDYVKRATDHNKKKKEIKRLKTLARDRNPDEFNYRMLSEIKLVNSYQ